MTRLRGYLWFARRYGIRRLWRYERLRRGSVARVTDADIRRGEELARKFGWD